MNILKIAPALPTMAIPFGIYCVLSALTSVDLIDIIFIPTLVGTPIGLTGGEFIVGLGIIALGVEICLLYTSPSPRDRTRSRMPSSA